MKSIFEQGEFSQYRVTDLREARSSITESFIYGEKTPTVFLSHKHDDLDELKDIIGFLQSKYKVRVYIDSRDPTMPAKTSGKTAENIKNRIKQCGKFILLATNGAIESKWCNWELGFGDAHKYKDNIALFPIKPKGKYDYEYRGNEYMSIYPYIAFYNGYETYRNGDSIASGYYVCTNHDDNSLSIVPLSTWLKKER